MLIRYQTHATRRRINKEANPSSAYLDFANKGGGHSFLKVIYGCVGVKDLDDLQISHNPVLGYEKEQCCKGSGDVGETTASPRWFFYTMCRNLMPAISKKRESKGRRVWERVKIPHNRMAIGELPRSHWPTAHAHTHISEPGGQGMHHRHEGRVNLYR